MRKTSTFPLPQMPAKSPAESPAESALSRRRLFAGAGAAGALAAAVAVLPRQPEPAAAAAAEPSSEPQAGGGYQLTAHVQRYYQTAKV